MYELSAKNDRLSSILRMLKFLVSRMFSRYVIIGSQVDQFVDIFPVNVIASSQKDCVDRDLRPQFQTFHTVISGDHITSHCQCPVILKQHYIMFLQIRLNGIWNLCRARCTIWCQRNRTDGCDILDHVVHVHRTMCHGKSGSCRRMCMYDCAYILPLFIAS